MMKQHTNKKNIQLCIPALLCAAVLLLIEIGIALFVHDRFVRPYGGDILVTVLLCCLWRGFMPLPKRDYIHSHHATNAVPLSVERDAALKTVSPSIVQRLMPLWVFLFACFVEVLQAVDIVNLLGLGGSAFFRCVIGTSFSFLDILCYAVGCIGFTIAEIAVLRWKQSH